MLNDKNNFSKSILYYYFLEKWWWNDFLRYKISVNQYNHSQWTQNIHLFNMLSVSYSKKLLIIFHVKNKLYFVNKHHQSKNLAFEILLCSKKKIFLIIILKKLNGMIKDLPHSLNRRKIMLFLLVLILLDSTFFPKSINFHLLFTLLFLT